MHRVIVAIITLLSLIGSPRHLSAATKVFLLAGQSNMLGLGGVDWGDKAPPAPYNAPLTAVKIWNNADTTGNDWKTLQVGFGYQKTEQNKGQNAFGPELAFGHTLHGKFFPNDDIYLVKYASGSTNLAKDWNPAGDRNCFSVFKTRVHAALKNLSDAGKNPEVAGMIWMQGENDAGKSGCEVNAAAYKNNLINFIKTVRKEFSADDMPFVMGRIGPYYGTPERREVVREAQMAMPGLVSRTAWIDTDDLQINPTQPRHYGSQGLIDLGARFATAMAKLCGAKPVDVGTGGTANTAVAWELDGKPISADNGFDFQPGVSHVLTARRVGNGSAIAVMVKKTFPNGQVESLAGVLDKDSAQVSLQLGPLTASTVYEFQAGMVFRKGYRLELSAKAANETTLEKPQRFYQALAEKVGWEHFSPGDADRVEYVSGIRAGNFRWDLAVSMSSPLALKLDPTVLIEQDQLKINYGASFSATSGGVDCVLRITDAGGREILRNDVRAKAVGPSEKRPAMTSDWQIVSPDVHDWAPGDYRIELWPKIDGRLWQEGASVIYRRRKVDSSSVAVSPFASWKLQRDPSRKEISWTDFGDVCNRLAGKSFDKAQWELRKAKSKGAALFQVGDGKSPVVLQPNLRGYYAVFAVAQEACMLQIGRKGLIRPVLAPMLAQSNGVFAAAADLTDDAIAIYGFDNAKAGLRSLRLTPVTAESVAAFYGEAGHPPTPLIGVNDWCDYFHAPCRCAADQFETLLGAQAELGMRALVWSAGRSWVEYHSKLKDATLFPCVPFENAKRIWSGAENYRWRIAMLRDYCPLTTVCDARKQWDLQIWPSLGMQRHYGTTEYGGMFSSKFYRDHPEWRRHAKASSKPREGGMSYYVPEVRKERVDILLEIADKNCDGILVDCCRQAPMLLYNRKMVAEYQRKTGVDVLKIDGTAGKQYEDWITWRADFFTRVLRDLRSGLADIEKRRGCKIPVAVRVPSVGLAINMAQGLAVERWCQEKLVDVLQVEPLATCGALGSQDMRPYLDLRRRYSVRVIAGIGQTWTSQLGFASALKRAAGLLAENPDGIEIYESNQEAQSTQRRWVLALFGNQKRLAETLGQTNLEACYPIESTTACYGFDNHSFRAAGWDINGFTDLSL